MFEYNLEEAILHNNAWIDASFFPFVTDNIFYKIFLGERRIIDEKVRGSFFDSTRSLFIYNNTGGTEYAFLVRFVLGLGIYQQQELVKFSFKPDYSTVGLQLETIFSVFTFRINAGLLRSIGIDVCLNAIIHVFRLKLLCNPGLELNCSLLSSKWNFAFFITQRVRSGGIEFLERATLIKGFLFNSSNKKEGKYDECYIPQTSSVLTFSLGLRVGETTSFGERLFKPKSRLLYGILLGMHTINNSSSVPVHTIKPLTDSQEEIVDQRTRFPSNGFMLACTWGTNIAFAVEASEYHKFTHYVEFRKQDSVVSMSNRYDNLGMDVSILSPLLRAVGLLYSTFSLFASNTETLRFQFLAGELMFSVGYIITNYTVLFLGLGTMLGSRNGMFLNDSAVLEAIDYKCTELMLKAKVSLMFGMAVGLALKLDVYGIIPILNAGNYTVIENGKESVIFPESLSRKVSVGFGFTALHF